jgi:ActR/RegA family two-component response regulator
MLAHCARLIATICQLGPERLDPTHLRGFEVETAFSAREGVQKLDAAVFHMVITDMRMETESAGFDVIRAANKKPYKPARSY